MALDMKRMIKALKRTDEVITPILNDWLVKKGDDALSGEVADIIRGLMVEQPRDRSASFSASSAGQCLRRQVLGYLGARGTVTDVRLQNIFNDGKWRHMRWQAMCLSAGILTDIEDPQFWPNKRARGTMDGIGIVPNDHARAEWRGKEFVFELKGVSSYLYPKYKDEGPKEGDHLQQLGRYFLHTGYDLGIIVYEDKSTQDWKEWVIEADSPQMQRIINRQIDELDQLNECVDTETIPPCSCESGKQSETCAMYKHVSWPVGGRF